MCGIVGYVGGQQAAPFLLEGLTQLEYRGYDSAGIAVLGSTGARVLKRAGRVRDLQAAVPKRFAGRVGIGHTRWATHGAPSRRERAPAPRRVGPDRGGAQRHHRQRRRPAAPAHRRAAWSCASETDTEVLAHLVARSEAPTLEEAVLDALAQIEGTYGIAVLDADAPGPDRRRPQRLARSCSGSATRRCSWRPTLAALVRHTRQVVHLDDGELATVTAVRVHARSPDDQQRTDRRPSTIEVSAQDYALGDHDHYMHKEILEQPASAERVLRGRLDDRFATAHLGGLNLDAARGPRGPPREDPRLRLVATTRARWARA